ncbi:MAG: LapA family protein [Acidimicrobiia bacterium]
MDTTDNEKDAQALPSTDMAGEGDQIAPEIVRERVFVGTGLFWGLIVGVVLALVVVILAAQNTDKVTISFLGWEFSTPLIVVVLGALLIGIVLDELFGLVYRKRRRRTLRERDELQRLR